MRKTKIAAAVLAAVLLTVGLVASTPQDSAITPRPLHRYAPHAWVAP